MSTINNFTPSFQGTIRIKSFEKSFAGDFLNDISTTKSQDYEIKRLVRTMVRKDTRTDTWPSPISKEDSDKIYELLEKIIGRPLRNVDNPKVIKYSGDHIVFGDTDAGWCGGEHISISLDA